MSFSKSSSAAFLLHLSCVRFMVISERECAVVQRCQGVCGSESSSGRNPQLVEHFTNIWKMSNNVKLSFQTTISMKTKN